MSRGADVIRPDRLLVVLPSWIGDAVMATAALRWIRQQLAGAHISALARPGIDDVLAGGSLVDELCVGLVRGMMGPQRIARRLRPGRFDTALLLTNSFSTALVTRLAGIPRRVGYDRDARSLLLTHPLHAPRRPDGRWAPVPAVTYYRRAAEAMLSGGDAFGADPLPVEAWSQLPDGARLELAIAPPQQQHADELLARARIDPDQSLALINPGGNRESKRWPPERFAAVADHLSRRHGLRVLVNGSPAERPVVEQVMRQSREALVSLPDLGITPGALKAIIARCRIVVTNDTGPRHFAVALGVPVVTLFGPTDPRWTLVPAPAGEIMLVADPSLPPELVADDHPDRCRIDRIGLAQAIEAVDRLLTQRRGSPQTP